MNIKNNNEVSSLRQLSGKSIHIFAENYNIPLRDLRAWESGAWDPPSFIPKLLRVIIKCEIIIGKNRIKELESDLDHLYQTYLGIDISSSAPGEIITQTRKYFDLTKSQFSRKYGIPYTTLSEWENNRRVPKNYTMTLLKKLIVYSKEIEGGSNEKNIYS